MLAILGLVPGEAQAQAITQNQVDFDTARSDAALGTSPTPANFPTFGSLVSYGMLSPVASQLAGNSQGEEQQAIPLPVNIFAFNLLSPFNYYASYGSGKPETAAEVTPEAKLGFAKRPEESPVQFSGFIDTSSDRYSGSPPNTDKLDGQFRIDVVGGGEYPDRTRYIPYFSYSPQQTYKDFFGKSTPFTQDIALGINKLNDYLCAWPSGSSLRCRSMYGQEGGIPMWEIGAQLAIQRRLVNSGRDSTALLLGPSVKWSMVNAAQWPHCTVDACGAISASLGTNVVRRWYSSHADISESVWNLSPIFTVAWVLPGRFVGGQAAAVGNPELDFQAAYNDISSNLPENDSHDWTVGLIIRVGTTF